MTWVNKGSNKYWPHLRFGIKLLFHLFKGKATWKWQSQDHSGENRGQQTFSPTCFANCFRVTSERHENKAKQKILKQVYYGPTVSLLYYVSTVTVSSLTACGIAVCWVYFFLRSVWLEAVADFFLTGEKRRKWTKGWRSRPGRMCFWIPFCYKKKKKYKKSVYLLLFNHLHTPTLVFLGLWSQVCQWLALYLSQRLLQPPSSASHINQS